MYLCQSRCCIQPHRWWPPRCTALGLAMCRWELPPGGLGCLSWQLFAASPAAPSSSCCSQLCVACSMKLTSSINTRSQSNEDRVRTSQRLTVSLSGCPAVWCQREARMGISEHANKRENPSAWFVCFLCLPHTCFLSSSLLPARPSRRCSRCCLCLGCQYSAEMC